MNIQEADFSNADTSTDWFKGFAGNLLHQLVGLTKDQLALYCVIILLIGADEAPNNIIMWRRKLRAYTGLPARRLEIALAGLADAGKIKVNESIISLRAAP
jgi:hypothetical protein